MGFGAARMAAVQWCGGVTSVGDVAGGAQAARVCGGRAGRGAFGALVERGAVMTMKEGRKEGRKE